MDAEAVTKLVAVTTDIALVIDRDGVVRDYSIGNDSVSRESDFSSWVGRPWVETVTVESRPKIEQLLKDAGRAQPAPWRQVNHPVAGGAGDLPIRYATLQTGANGRIVAFGRELRAISLLQQKLVEAQQAMEREYARVRAAETRYRLLFQLSDEPVAIVDANSLRIVEANPAASRLLKLGPKRSSGRSFVDAFDAGSAGALQGLLAAVRLRGKADSVRVGLASESTRFVVSASLFRQDAGAQMLVRIIPEEPTRAASADQPSAKLNSVIDRIPDAFVVVGLDRRILTVNTAFLELAQLATVDQAVGEQLDTWIGRSTVDVNVLVSNLREHGAVRHFSSVVRGQLGVNEEVEISAVAVPEGDPPCYGFSIRSTRGRLFATGADGGTLPRSVEQLKGLVGQVPLKNLVRETTDLIERLCIEAALEIVGDNRVSAAELLGLSRQSLYVKLRRYGLGDLDSED
jgi:transcriptional regulator PpsR